MVVTVYLFLQRRLRFACGTFLETAVDLRVVHTTLGSNAPSIPKYGRFQTTSVYQFSVYKHDSSGWYSPRFVAVPASW